MQRKQRLIAYDDDMYIEEPRRIDVHVAEDDADPPVILVPDGNGDYRQHSVVGPRRRMGFL